MSKLETKFGQSMTQRSDCPDIQEPRKALTPEAERALAEAEQRRKVLHEAKPAAKEVGGRTGPDPIRFGDWETGGIASDF